jgi:TetR/AcrR family transcriptional repressor of nem operon
MKQRKKQPAVTRQLILDAAGAEFTAHGYSGAGLSAIVSKAGLTKGALFHHFPDKRSLALSWISSDLADAVRALWIDPLDGIDSLGALRSFCRARCLEIHPFDGPSTLVSIAAETATSEPLLGTVAEVVFAGWRSAVAALLERGQSAAWIHHSILPAVEAGVIVSVFSGLTVATKCNPEESFRRACAAGVEGYLETLRPQ